MLPDIASLGKLALKINHLLLGLGKSRASLAKLSLHARRVLGTFLQTANLQFQRPICLSQGGKLISTGGILRFY